jgi:hypothetical protein
MFLVVPHGQLGHVPVGQLPPQLFANDMPNMMAKNKRIFIFL